VEVVKTLQLITSQACLEQVATWKSRDPGVKPWRVCMGETVFVYLDLNKET